MTTFLFLKFVHMLAATLYVGASFVNGLQELSAVRSGDAGLQVAALRFAGLNNRVFLVPATVLLLGTGIGMAWMQGTEILASWLRLPLFLFFILTVILAFSIRLEDRLHALAASAHARAEPTGADFARLSRRAMALGPLASLLILAILALMVLKRAGP
ncbi:MAG: DUF2269 family protein [bacterium]|jgi:uncharacterized membrane protein